MDSVKPSLTEADSDEFTKAPSIPTSVDMMIPATSPVAGSPPAGMIAVSRYVSNFEQDLLNGNIVKGSSLSDMIATSAGEDESNMFSETPLKRKESGSEMEAAKRAKTSESGDKNDGAVVYLDSENPEGKSEAELKKLVDCGLKAFESLLTMKDKQLLGQCELVSQEIIRREEMERKYEELAEKLLAHEKRLEQLQAERDYIYHRGFKDVCSKLLTSDEFGMRMCSAVHAGVECVLSQNSEASHDALTKILDLVQGSEYNLLGVIHPEMSFDTFKAWSLEPSPYDAPVFQV